MPPDPAALERARREYWRRNVRLTALLLTLGGLVTYGIAWFARELSFGFFGWPFAFWVGGQGALLVYLLIISLYARRMKRLDRDYGETAGRR